MAKKKIAQIPEPEPAPTPLKAKPRETILSLKGSSEWADWLGSLAGKFRTTKAGIIDRALMEFAERNAFREPPER